MSIANKPLRPPANDGAPRPQTYEQHIPVRLGKAASALEEAARLILGDVVGLGLTDFRILAYLADRPSASIADISRDLLVDKAWISRLLRVLGDKRYIRKRRDLSDSRIVLASLTDEGRAVHETALGRVNSYYGAIMDGVDSEVAAGLITRLEHNLLQIASDLRSQAPPAD